MTIGNRLRIFRKELNLSAKDMSALAGVALRTYGGYERDEITISPKLIMFLFSDYRILCNNSTAYNVNDKCTK